MTYYKYYTIETPPENFQDDLNKHGKAGWKYVNVITMQKQIPVPLNIPNKPGGYRIETRFLVIFEKTKEGE